MAQSRLLNGAPLGFSNTININYKATRCKSKSTFFKNGIAGVIEWILKQIRWAQTCMDSKVDGLKSGSCRIWQRTDLPPSSNMLRRAAQTCSVCKLAGVQIIPRPTLANQILARTFFRFRLASACVPSRWKVLSGEFRRRPTELVIKLRNPDRVGRRGLSEPREDFSRLPTKCCLIPWLESVADAVALQLAYPAVEKFCRASSTGGHGTCNKTS